jgi:hypothetical protein
MVVRQTLICEMLQVSLVLLPLVVVSFPAIYFRHPAIIFCSMRRSLPAQSRARMAVSQHQAPLSEWVEKPYLVHPIANAGSRVSRAAETRPWFPEPI